MVNGPSLAAQAVTDSIIIAEITANPIYFFLFIAIPQLYFFVNLA